MSQRVIKFDRLDSTSNYVAKGLDSGTYSLGDVIMSGFQTEGRGQRGSLWQSIENTNLTFSYAMDVSFLNFRDQFMASKAISVGIVDYLKGKHSLSAKIKWPNDILQNSKKLCGMLLETKKVGDKRLMIIGIGLNINQMVFDTGFEATSLAIECGKEFDLEKELLFLLEFIKSSWSKLVSLKFGAIQEDYIENLYGTDTSISLSSKAGTFQGTILGADNEGLLSVKLESGEIKNYRSGEVKLIY